jgi:hypothetical protein
MFKKVNNITNREIDEIDRLLLEAIKRARKLYRYDKIKPFDILILCKPGDAENVSHSEPIIINDKKLSRLAMIMNGRILKPLRKICENKNEFFVWYSVVEDNQWTTKLIKYGTFMEKFGDLVTHASLMNKINPINKMPLVKIKKKMIKIYSKYNSSRNRFFKFNCCHPVIDNDEKIRKLIVNIASEMNIINVDPFIEKTYNIMESVIIVNNIILESENPINNMDEILILNE